MGRFAAIVWALAGSLVLLAAILEAPKKFGEIAGGYGVKDARTILLGCAIAAAAGIAAFVAARRAWNGRGWQALALPAMMLAAGAIGGAILIERAEFLLGGIPLLASPYGIFLIGPGIMAGAVATFAVSAVDAGIVRLSRPPG